MKLKFFAILALCTTSMGGTLTTGTLSTPIFEIGTAAVATNVTENAVNVTENGVQVTEN